MRTQINFKLLKSLHQNFTLGSFFDINYANSGINKSTAAVRPGANFHKNSTRPVESGVNRRC
jgi:hypothetical protein